MTGLDATKEEARTFQTREAVIPMAWAKLDDVRRLVEATLDFPGEASVRLAGLQTDVDRPQERYFSSAGEVRVRDTSAPAVIPGKGQG